jgi:hypothetical protein
MAKPRNNGKMLSSIARGTSASPGLAGEPWSEDNPSMISLEKQEIDLGSQAASIL